VLSKLNNPLVDWAVSFHHHGGDNLAAEGRSYGEGIGGGFGRAAILKLHLHIHHNPYRGLTLEEVLQQVLNANRRKRRRCPTRPIARFYLGLLSIPLPALRKAVAGVT
jgi:hypothetical protein